MCADTSVREFYFFFSTLPVEFFLKHLRTCLLFSACTSFLFTSRALRYKMIYILIALGGVDMLSASSVSRPPEQFLGHCLRPSLIYAGCVIEDFRI